MLDFFLGISATWVVWIAVIAAARALSRPSRQRARPDTLREALRAAASPARWQHP